MSVCGGPAGIRNRERRPVSEVNSPVASPVTVEQALRSATATGANRQPQRTPNQGRVVAVARASASRTRRMGEPALTAIPRCGSGPSTALKSSFCVPSVKARKFGSKEKTTTRPAPTGSSTTAAVPPSSVACAAKPEMKKSLLWRLGSQSPHRPFA